MASLNRTVVGGKETLRAMLLTAGIGEYNATLSLPYMYFLPRTCDPFTQGVMQLVEGLQNLLKGRGQRVPVDGFLGPETAAAVAKFAGAGWSDKTWLQIYGDVIRGRLAPGFEPGLAPIDHTIDDAAADAQIPTGGLTDVVGGIARNPLAWVVAGAGIFYWFGLTRPNPRSRR